MAEYNGDLAKIRIDTADVGGASATWVTIGQQKDGSVSRSTGTEDASTKDDSGWEKDVIVSTGWTITCDVTFNPADAAYIFLKNKWKTQAKLWVSCNASAIAGGVKEEGQAIITRMDEKYPHRALVTASLEFKMQGAPVICSS